MGIKHGGRDCQRYGTARATGQDPERIFGEAVGVVGNEGDSQCYLGVVDKVDAIQDAIARRIDKNDLKQRLLVPFRNPGVSDGQLNGTTRMRNSLIGREVANDAAALHLTANDLRGTIAVVACDKPPVGTLAALLEHNQPALMIPDGSIKPGVDPRTGEPIDIVSCFQSPDDDTLAHHACPGHGSCGGMFTYNTMQSAFAGLGITPVEMVSPASEDPRRLEEFPEKLVDYLENLMKENITPRDIVTAASIKNAVVIAIAMGGSTNVVLHMPEIARSAGLDLWKDVISQEEFNELSKNIPVITNARPYGKYSMVDIDEKGGLQVVIQELLNKGLLDGTCITCTGETLAEQVARLSPPSPDGDVIYMLENPFKPTGGLRILKGNLAPDGGAVIKMAGVEQGIDENGVFEGMARVFNSEKSLIRELDENPDSFNDHDMVVIRYEGVRGAPGMPEMLDPTSRITTICRQRGITIALMTDARFSGGSVGLVIGHVSPEAFEGGPIALIQDGDTIFVDTVNNTINCAELGDADELARRKAEWQMQTDDNGGTHPDAHAAEGRLERRTRFLGRSPLEGAGVSL